MRNQLSISLIAVFVSLSTSSAWAQRGGRGGFGRGGNVLFLMRGEAVQEELELSADQVTELGELMSSQLSAAGDLQSATPEERREIMEELATEAREGLAEILNEEQQKRLAELELQQQGPMAITKEEVAAKLKLTDEQKQSIDEIVAEVADARREIFEQAGEGEDRRAAFGRMRQMQQEAGERILTMLDETQSDAWKAMLGSPFEFPRRGPRGGGDGERRRRRGGDRQSDEDRST